MSSSLWNHILVPTDGSPSALTAAQYAGLICGPGGGVRLLHVTTGLRDLAAYGFDTVAGMTTGVTGDLHDQVRLQEMEGAAKLLEQAKAALPAGLSAQTEWRQGVPAAEILEVLQRPEMDSVVLGSRGRGAIARALFGSVADRVAREADKPVLIARGSGARRVLVGVDGSEPSVRAVQTAVVLARKMGAGIELIHVVDVPAASRSPAAAIRTGTEAILNAAVAAMGDKAGLQFGSSTAFGEPAHEILEQASRLGTDLIVLGRRGRQPEARLPLGSVAQRVVTHAQASVCLIP